SKSEACYWAAMSYQRMSDIATLFGGRSHAKAHRYFVRAVQLAPARTEYRQALFDFLLESADSSASALHEAQQLVDAVGERDPDYAEMRLRLAAERREDSSLERRAAKLLVMGERTAFRFATAPLAVK